MIGRAQDARGRLKSAGGARYGGLEWGMGWAAHRKSLIFGCQASFSELANPSHSCMQRLASPCVSRRGVEKSWGSLEEALE